MRKITSAIVLLGFLAFLVFPLAVSAIDLSPPSETCKMGRDITIGDTTYSEGQDVYVAGPDSIFCLLNTIYNATDWVFVVLIGVVVIFSLIGGIGILTSGGDATKMNDARNKIVYAIVGLVVAFLAKAIPGIARLLIG